MKTASFTIGKRSVNALNIKNNNYFIGFTAEFNRKELHGIKCSSTHDEFTTVYFRLGSLIKKKRIFLNLSAKLGHILIIENSRKRRLRTVRKRCSLADRERCQVNRLVKRSATYPYLYCKLISLHKKYRVSIKQPLFIRLLPFMDRPC